MAPISCWPGADGLPPGIDVLSAHEYNGKISESNETLDVILLFTAIAVWNGILTWVLVFSTFRVYRGTYFYSLLCSGSGVIILALGNTIHDLQVVHTKNGVEGLVTMSIIGWWLTVTGQLFVLWSRLGLLVSGHRGDLLKRWTLWMIIVGSICLYVPTSVLAWGANIDAGPSFVRGYTIMEKIQLSGFFVQEFILSTIYIILAVHYLRTSITPRARVIMIQLVLINVILVGFDLAVLILEALELFVMQTALKPFFYSVKLLLEFAILSRLVEMVGGAAIGSNPTSSTGPSRRSSTVAFIHSPASGTSSEREKPRRASRSFSRWSPSSKTTMNEDDISDFVDVEKIVGDITRAVSFTNPLPGQRKILLHDQLTVSDTDLVQPRAGFSFVQADRGQRLGGGEGGFGAVLEEKLDEIAPDGQ